MSILLPFDTETTGFPDYHNPSDGPDQPHLVQLAAILVDSGTREEIKEMSVIIKPDGWESDPGALAAHGITTERAMDEGIPELDALEEFMNMWSVADTRIGHNESFDRRIIRIAQFHCWEHVTHGNKDVDWTVPEQGEMVQDWVDGDKYCTMWKAKPIMKMNPTVAMHKAGFHGKKPPKLTEAYEYFIGKPLEGAHDAMVDTRATLEVYWAIQDLEKGES